MKKLIVLLAALFVFNVTARSIAEVIDNPGCNDDCVYGNDIAESSIAAKYRSPITIYVDDVTDPLEDGSFEHPFDKIQEAIDAASSGDKIIVNEGRYYENLVIDNLDITLNSSDPDNPYVALATVIDGYDLDSVIKITDSNSVIGGFSIVKGRADTGGGINCQNSNLVISNCIIVSNETSHAGAGGNSGDGGGIYALSSVLEIKNCEIGWNQTGKGGNGGDSGSGAGIYCSSSCLTVTGCDIVGNMTGSGGDGAGVGGNGGDSGSGAGIYCLSSCLTVTDCDIAWNLTGNGGNAGGGDSVVGGSSGSGGGIYCYAGSVKIQKCTINSNKSGNGGSSGSSGYGNYGGQSGSGAGIYLTHTDILGFIDCEIIENTIGQAGDGSGLGGSAGGISGSGGGVYLSSSNSIQISRCSFTSNSIEASGGGEFGSKGGSGGGLYCSSPASVNIINCQFSNNQAANGGPGWSYGGSGGDGGGIAIISPYAGLTDCRLVDNKAGNGKPTFIVPFTSKGGSGGGLYCSGDSANLNCLITGNSSGTGAAGGNGGGIYAGSAMTLTNCTITGNTANTAIIDQDGKGGGIYSEAHSEISNTILWNNFAGQITDESAQLDGGTHTVNYSCVQGWTGGLGGLANIGYDPLFADPGNDDFHLKSEYGYWDAISQNWIYDTVTSPCIDGGDPCSVWTEEPQPNGERINMGAYGGTPEASMSLSSLVGWWKFNEQGGTGVSDSSGYGNPGILVNGPVWSGNGSLGFDGIDDYVQVADSNSLDIQDELTISVWIYMDQYSTDWPKLVIKPYDSADTDPWELYTLDLGHYGTYPRFIIKDGFPGGNSVYAIDSSYTLSLSKWHHIVGTYDGSEASLYIDGVLVNSMNGTVQIGTNNLPLSIGGRMGNRSFKGLMDDVRIYKRGLTESEVINLYDSMLPSFSLVGCWEFNETSGTEASDLSGYGNAGILVNGPVWSGNGSLGFDGIDDYVQVADSPSLDIQNELTISAWIYMDQYSTDWPKLVIKPYDSADTDPWELYTLDLGHYGTYPRFIITDGTPGGDSVYALDSSYTLSLSKWHHIVGTYDGSKASLYIDGMLVNSMNGTIQIGTNNLPLSIGGRMGHRSFKGLMDDVRIYNRGLTRSEVADLYFNEPDLMVMVPAGWFAYQNAPIGSYTFVESFSISKYETTVSQYCKFLNAADPDGIYWHSGQEILKKGDPGNHYYEIQSGRDNYPVGDVSLYDCLAYTAWKSSITGLNYRLPTEQEWAKAAGWDPVLQKLWTYGFQQDTISCNWCNYNECAGGPIEVGYYDGVNPGTNDARSFYGCYDMSGNLMEWTPYGNTWYHHVRGGDWYGSEKFCQVIYHFYPVKTNYKSPYLGFRLVLDY